MDSTTQQERVFTRKMYMGKECTHDEFYGQFVNERVISRLARLKERIAQSQDPHFNDIPLRLWDSLIGIKDCIDRDKWRKALEWNNPKTYPWSLSDQVCVAKAAAKMIKENGGH